jgi:hypothetical protein
MTLPLEGIADSAEAKESNSRETLSEEGCCVCGYVRQAQILLTCALCNKWICRTCASHVKAQIECVRMQEEMQVTGKEKPLRRQIKLRLPSSNAGTTDKGRRVAVPSWNDPIESRRNEQPLRSTR